MDKENQTNKEVEELKKRDWKRFLIERFGFPDEYDLITTKDLKKLKRKKYFSGFMTGIFILIGLSLISGILLYGTYYDKFKSEIICEGSNLTCDNSCPVCTLPDINCPTCSNNCICPEFPDNIDINFNNES